MYELRHSLTSKTQYTVCQKYEIVEIQKQMMVLKLTLTEEVKKILTTEKNPQCFNPKI